MQSKVIHLSIDDVESIFVDLIMRKDYSSLFDQALLNWLRSLHHSYGMKVSLYSFEYIRQFHISEIPDSFSLEFERNSDWLKIGFHGIRNTLEKDFSLSDYLRSIEVFYREVERFACDQNKTYKIRLHGYILPRGGTESLSNLLGDRKSFCLFSSEDLTRECYSVKPSEFMSHNLSSHDSLIIPSDFRIESEIGLSKMVQRVKTHSRSVIFTHEWAIKPESLRRSIVKTLLPKKGFPNYRVRRKMRKLISAISSNVSFEV